MVVNGKTKWIYLLDEFLVILDKKEIEYLLSNILEEIILPEEMRETYFRKWQIENDYDI